MFSLLVRSVGVDRAVGEGLQQQAALVRRALIDPLVRVELLVHLVAHPADLVGAVAALQGLQGVSAVGEGLQGRGAGEATCRRFRKKRNRMPTASRVGLVGSTGRRRRYDEHRNTDSLLLSDLHFSPIFHHIGWNRATKIPIYVKFQQEL